MQMINETSNENFFAFSFLHEKKFCKKVKKGVKERERVIFLKNC